MSPELFNAINTEGREVEVARRLRALAEFADMLASADVGYVEQRGGPRRVGFDLVIEGHPFRVFVIEQKPINGSSAVSG